MNKKKLLFRHFNIFTLCILILFCMSCTDSFGICNASCDANIAIKKNYTDSYIIKAGFIKQSENSANIEFEEISTPYNQESFNYFYDQNIPAILQVKQNFDTYVLCYASNSSSDFRDNFEDYRGDDETWEYKYCFQIYDKTTGKLFENYEIPFFLPRIDDGSLNKRIVSERLGNIEVWISYDIYYTI